MWERERKARKASKNIQSCPRRWNQAKGQGAPRVEKCALAARRREFWLLCLF